LGGLGLDDVRRVVREAVRAELASAGLALENLKGAVRSVLEEGLRSELTSGDAATRKLLADLLLSVMLKDSAGAELSEYVKNLDAGLSTRASESTLSAIKDSIDVKLSTVRDLFRPILKGSLFNAPVSANANIFASDLAPTYSPTAFRIYACFDASGVLSLVRTRAGTAVTEQLNSGSALTANAAYMFDVMVEDGETINLQYSVAATALVLKVVEVPGVVS
jgi:hypothetical protein